MAVITIIGSGMMGSALAFPARENENEVRLVGTHLDREIIDACQSTNRHPKFNRDFPDGIKFYQIEDVGKAIKDSDLIIGGVSSFGVDWFGEEILPIIPESTPIITVTKGLFDTPDGELLTYPQLWEKRLAEKNLHRKLYAIGGPCTSYELVAHDQTEVAFCGPDLDTLAKIREMLATGYYHISITEDVTGIESAVALKNGYALGIALTIGMNQKNFGIDSELHFNSQAAVFGQSVKEMARLLKHQGAYTLDNMCVGAGDLYVTVYGGRTRKIGILLGRGYSLEKAKEELNGVTLESLVVAERVARAVKKCVANGKLQKEDFPLLYSIDKILTEKFTAEIPWDSFTYTGRKYWNESEHNIFVAAHRGWPKVFPENTMVSFKAAVALGVDQLETDIRETKDGKLVLIHDSTVDRTTDGTGAVADMTYDELMQLDAGIKKSEQFRGCKIPTFIEFMEYVKDIPRITLDIELKIYPTEGNEKHSYEVCDRVLKIIDEYGFTDRVVINTFSGKLHEYIEERYGRKYRRHIYYPAARLGKCTRDPYKSDAFCCCMFGSEKSIPVADKEECDRMAASGIEPWAGAGVHDEVSVDMAIANGARLITCNNPDVILDLLRKKGYHE